MMNPEEFERFCRELKLSQEAIAYIKQTRSSPPSRRVGDFAMHNVCGRLASKKMSFTLQSESRTCETIFAMEAGLDNNVLEVWDQPPPLQLRRTAGGRLHVSSYTADYLVLRRDGVSIIQCKTRKNFEELLLSRPDDWASVDNSFQFVPASEAAQRLGLPHEIYVTGDWASTYLNNLEFLYALHLADSSEMYSALQSKARRHLEKSSLTILELCERVRGLTSPIVYLWIANGIIFGSLKAQLLTLRDTFVVFANESEAVARQKLILETYCNADQDLGSSDLAAILGAPSKAVEHAIRLCETYQEVIDGKRALTRNEYRYKAEADKAMEEGRDLLPVFLPRYADRGNRTVRLTADQARIVNDVIDKRYRTGAAHFVTHVSSHIDAACKRESVDLVCYETVRRHCMRIPQEEIARGQFGKRGYHATRRPVDSKHATLRSDVPGLLAHIDSTQLDTRLWAELPFSSVLACPWVYAFYDEGSSRALGSWVGFGKSDRFALALAFRDMAARQHRIPPYIFADRGAEYGSTWWEQMLAERNLSKYMRAPGAPRFGGLEESSLKQLNVQLAHRLAGSTWPDQKGRSADGSKKSRETARLGFGIVVEEVNNYLYKTWSSIAHGSAEGNPDELFYLGIEKYGDVGRPVTMDLAFMISTSIPVKATLGPRKGIRVAYREYWSACLDELRRPLRLDECRLDPGHPSVLYARIADKWYVTTSRDHVKFQGMSDIGQALEYAYIRQRSAGNRADKRDEDAKLAARIEQLELSAILAATEESKAIEVETHKEVTVPAEIEDLDFDFDELDDIPFLEVAHHAA